MIPCKTLSLSKGHFEVSLEFSAYLDWFSLIIKISHYLVELSLHKTRTIQIQLSSKNFMDAFFCGVVL